MTKNFKQNYFSSSWKLFSSNSMKTQLIFLCLLLHGIVAFSQDKRGYNWTFGDSCGISFTNGSPLFFSSSEFTLNYFSGSTLSDKHGRLLLQTRITTNYSTSHPNYSPFIKIYNAYGDLLIDSIIATDACLFYSFREDDYKVHFLSRDPQFIMSPFVWILPVCN